MTSSDEQLLSVLATLEQCRTALRQARKDDTAQLVSMAILDLRMKLGHIGDAELKALCEQILLSNASDARSQRQRPRQCFRKSRSGCRTPDLLLPGATPNSPCHPSRCSSS